MLWIRWHPVHIPGTVYSCFLFIGQSRCWFIHISSHISQFLDLHIGSTNFLVSWFTDFVFIFINFFPQLFFGLFCSLYFFYNQIKFFLGPHSQHMEFPRLGVESELQSLAYTTAKATADPSLICNLHHSSQRHQILNPPSEARDWTCNVMVASRICFCCVTMGTPIFFIFLNDFYFFPL